MTHPFPTIILNPVSGQGSHQQRLQAITQSAKKLGWKGKLIETTPDKLANFAASDEYRKGQRQFVICGGDGTIVESIEALANKDATIGIVPLGTGNLLAKNLNLPLEIESAMQIALKGKAQKIDIGQANQTYFAVMAGMGVDARIMQDTSRNLKNIFGISAYYWTGITKLFHPPIRFTVSVDGESQQHLAKTVLVANMGKFAGKLEAVPHAHFDDGQLKIGILKAHTVKQLTDVALALLRGNINQSKYYTLLEGNHVIVTPSGQSQPYQCDGNNYPPTKELAVTIHPQAISIRRFKI